MKNLVCLVFLLSCILAPAQIIDNRRGNAFEEEMFFNQEFLWQNKIKTITGITSIKRPQRPIEQRPDVCVYKFNSVGLLEELNKVTSILHLVDSMTIQFKRNDLGEVELRTENGSRGFYTKKFIYNKEGLIERTDFGKSENTSTTKGVLTAGQSIVINSESFEYNRLDPLTLRKNCFNNYGLLYSSITYKKNDLGYMTSETEETVMSGRSTTKTYTYNEKGWISAIVFDNGSLENQPKHIFTYDPLGNLLKLEKFKGATLVQEIEILYTPTMLIEAVLDHDLQSRDILITKYSYEYHP